MSTEQEHARLIAERIAKRMSDRAPVVPRQEPNLTAELSAVRSTLSELERKLARIEAKISGESPTHGTETTTRLGSSTRPVPLTHSPWLAGVNATSMHPSEEKFGVEEAVVSELVDFFQKEKGCSLESSKPCDHCAMCSSRGF
jgi:hypothetical protein